MRKMLALIMLFLLLVNPVPVVAENNGENYCSCSPLDIGCWLNCISNMVEAILKWPSELPQKFFNYTLQQIENKTSPIGEFLNSFMQQVASPFTQLFLGLPVDYSILDELKLHPSEGAKFYLVNMSSYKNFSLRYLMDTSLKTAYTLLGFSLLVAVAAYILERGMSATDALRLIRRGIITLIFLPMVPYLYHMIAFIIAEFEAWILPPEYAFGLFAPLAFIGLALLLFVPAVMLFVIAMAIISATRLLITAVLVALLPIILALEGMPVVNSVATRLKNLFTSSILATIIGVFAFRIGIIAIQHFVGNALTDPAKAVVGLAIMFATYATPLIVALFGGGGAVVAVGSFIAGYITGTLQKVVQLGQKAIKTALTGGAGGAGAAAGASTRITETISSFTPRIKPENQTLLLEGGGEQE